MYDYIRIRLRALQESERGASAVEYGLLVALIAAVIILAVVALGDTLEAVFTNTEATISDNTAP
jgi:pilus assembly protein Flp/PilA